MKRANDESLDSPFRLNGLLKPNRNSKMLKRKLYGGISPETPTYFHLNHIDILDFNSRTQELLKGYKLAEKDDYKLIKHPELTAQDKKYFNYQDFSSSSKVFDYSAMKPSNLIDMMADKRPEFKKKSMFYVTYNEKLRKEGFGLTRGIFTVQSNETHKLAKTKSGFSVYSKPEKGFAPYSKKCQRAVSIETELIGQQALKLLPVQLRTGKAYMQRYLNNESLSKLLSS